MTFPDPPGPRSQRSTARCAVCDAPLAHDQRYCLECGTRRVPLPARIQAMLDEPADAGAVGPAPGPAHPVIEDQPSADGLMPAPRTVAVAVMAMLAFGVVVGSLTGRGGVESLADTLVLALPSLTHAGAPVPTTTLASVGSGTGSSPRPSTARCSMHRSS